MASCDHKVSLYVLSQNLIVITHLAPVRHSVIAQVLPVIACLKPARGAKECTIKFVI